MKNLIWYEKYRPQKLSDIVLPQKQMRTLKEYVRKKEIPHILFCGPPGSGKTTVSRILINFVASKKMILNASSNDRGIDTIKGKVKSFAMSQRQDLKLNVVFFDEADGLTPQAQEALKNTIEAYHENCRFIFTCNEIDKIILPIVSRCTVFKFDTVPKDELSLYIQKILRIEKIKYKAKDVNSIVNQFYPDVRSVINNIQSCSIQKVFNSKEVLFPFRFEKISQLIQKGKITALRNLWKNFIDFGVLYKWLFDEWIYEVDESARPDLAIIIAEYLYRDKGIANKEINITACFLEIMNILEKEIDFARK